MRRTVWAAAFAVWMGLAGVAGAEPVVQPAAGVDWLAGYWLSCADGTQTAEAWIGAGSGVLVGVNHGVRDGKTSFEYMRIGPGARGLAFFGSPGGAPPVEFPAASVQGGTATFENPAHDFPTRIVYSRQGDTLTARIEGPMDGRVERMEWTFRAAPLGAVCPAG